MQLGCRRGPHLVGGFKRRIVEGGHLVGPANATNSRLQEREDQNSKTGVSIRQYVDQRRLSILSRLFLSQEEVSRADWRLEYVEVTRESRQGRAVSSSFYFVLILCSCRGLFKVLILWNYTIALNRNS
jgi:hypothetical protein